MKSIQTDKAPLAIGPYSQAIVANGFIFCSGQLGLDPKSGELEKGIEKQTHRSIKNVLAVLEKAESGLENIVKTTIFVKDMNDFAKINEVYGSYFTGHKPARATVEVARLPKDGLVEIEAVALVK